MEFRGVPADTSSLIYLAKAGGLAAVRAALGPLLLAPAVWHEAVVVGESRGRGEVAWIRQAEAGGDVVRVELDSTQFQRARTHRECFGLGHGECEVLVLGEDDGMVLLDDRGATRTAGALGVRTLETIWTPVFCARAGALPVADARRLLYAITRHMTVPSELMSRVLRELEEEAR